MELKENNSTIWNSTFICVLICQVFLSLSGFIVNPLVSSYASFLGAGALLVGFVTSLYFGVAFALRPFAGPAMVIADKQKLLILSLALGTIANLCYAVFNNIPAFIAGRVLHGIHLCVVGSLLLTIASDSLPKERMASGLGILGIAGAFSTAIGPSIGLSLRTWGTSLFGEVGGYKTIFFASSIIIFLGLIPAFIMKVRKNTKEEMASVGVWYKNIIAPPAIPSAICAMLYNMSYSLYSAYMVPYAAQKGFVGVSLYFTIQALVMIVSRPTAGRLIDKYGASTVVYPSAVLYMASFVLLWKAQSIGLVYAAAVCASLGYGTAYPAFQAQCLQCVPRLRRGVASNTSYCGIDLGLFLGPVLGGAVLSASAGSVSSYSTMYLLGIIPIILTALTYTFFRKYVDGKIREVAQCGKD